MGDSISAAYGMSLEQGYVSKLEQNLVQHHPELTVVNASISGETTAGGLRRLPPLLQQHQPDLVIIELGGNDGLRGYPLEKLRHNLLMMTEASLEAGALVILLPMEIPPNYGSRYTAGFRAAYQQITEQTNTMLGPFILEGVATNPALMQEDGIHPTAEAQPLLLDKLMPNVLQALETL